MKSNRLPTATCAACGELYDGSVLETCPRCAVKPLPAQEISAEQIAKLAENLFQRIWQEIPLHRRAGLMQEGAGIDPLLQAISHLTQALSHAEQERDKLLEDWQSAHPECEECCPVRGHAAPPTIQQRLRDAEARLTDLEAENQTLGEMLENSYQARRELQQQIDELAADHTRLQQDLREYGQHKPKCLARFEARINRVKVSTDNPCTCGFDQLSSRLGDPT